MRCSFVGLADSFIVIIEGTVGVLKRCWVAGNGHYSS